MARKELMVRCLTEADDYKCPLSEETQGIAEEELRETKSARSQALSAIRNWMQQNPKFKAVRMDANFLLRFLRTKKFSVPMAQEAMERYVLLRQSWGIAFNQLDYKLPVMMELIDLGYIFVSPFKDKGGRRVIIYRPGVFDPYKYTNQDMCRVMGICYETLMEDEESQVRGLVHFADGSGVSFPHLTLFTPKEAVRIVKNGERTIPMRHKEIYGVNVHPTIKFALDFGMALISEKIRKRVRLYTSPTEVEIDKSLLPQEYGGVMPMREMIELWKEELAMKRDILLLGDKMAVRLEMYSEAAREGAISVLRAGANTCAGTDAVGDAMRGLTGNFRKLEVD
ncbi:alpha-tocopherol transfer protein-like [Hyposmocoma kahamanoa]|uniref:alpha-tocopherol transfer protein-like n=1 Tax=Hyposmocoma kahamanoa TaxID=1477025 RepID=UPI000E6D72E9|nr:alpha-tocopherol transfer protein-like [Hyposmocoma kahamanoa]XP_026317850.1 alpha-tocopherol transfer protein-like [Hyposmocoma kahamanoa]